MIYNESGIIINSFTEKLNLEAFDLLCEATNDPEIESKLQMLKDTIKDCSPDSLNNIKSDDKKYHFLTDKVRKVLGAMQFISCIGSVGSIVSIKIALDKKFNDTIIKVIFGIIGFFSVAFITLNKIVEKSDENANKYRNSRNKEIQELARDSINKLLDIQQNNKLPKEVRDKAKENIEKIRNIISGRAPVESPDNSNNYLDFEIDGIKVYSEIGDKFNKNKSFYNSALKSFKSKFASEMKRIRKELKDFGEGYEYYTNGDINSIILDDKYAGPIVYDTDEVDEAYGNPNSAVCACLCIYIESTKKLTYDDGEPELLKITMIYTKSKGYYSCDWNPLGER